MYKLRKNTEAFEVVDGAFAGRKYRHGVTYPEIPPEEKHRFEKVHPKLSAVPAPAEKAEKKDGGKKK